MKSSDDLSYDKFNNLDKQENYDSNMVTQEYNAFDIISPRYSDAINSHRALISERSYTDEKSNSNEIKLPVGNNVKLPPLPDSVRISNQNSKELPNIEEAPLKDQNTNLGEPVRKKRIKSAKKTNLVVEKDYDMGVFGVKKISNIGEEYSIRKSDLEIKPDQSGFNIYEVPDELKLGDHKAKFSKRVDTEEKEEQESENQPLQEKEEEVDLFVTKEEKESMEKESKKISHKIVIDSDMFNGFINLFTIFSIFADDFKKWCFGSEVDYIFDVLTIAAFIFFTIEFICKVDLGRGAFCYSMNCFLDFMSTISLIADLAMVSEDIMAGGGGAGGGGADKAKFGKAGRASRVGTKVGRLVKVVRLLRLTKLTKLFNKDTGLEERERKEEEACKKAIERMRKAKDGDNLGSCTGDFTINTLKTDDKQKGKEEAMINPVVLKRIKEKEKLLPEYRYFELGDVLEDKNKKGDDDEQDEAMELPKESKIGAKITAQTLKKIIIIVQVQLMVIPMFQSSYYNVEDVSYIFDVQNFATATQCCLDDRGVEGYSYYLIEKYREKGLPILNQTMQYQNDEPNHFIYIWENTDFGEYGNIRNTEKKFAFATIEADSLMGYRQVDIVMTLSVKPEKVFVSWLSIQKTFTVCVLLTIVSMSFSNDSNAFILKPVEKLSEYINTLMKDPSSLYPDWLMEQLSDKKNKKKGYDIIEYHIIQMNLMKIATFLGAAQGKCAETICRPLILFKKDIPDIKMSPKQQGFFAIVGLNDMQYVIKYLREDSITYINKIFDICHNVADRYSGTIDSRPENKFQLLWKIHIKEDMILIEKNKLLSEKSTQASITIFKILCKIYRSIDIMQKSDMITNKMISKFIGKANKLLEYQQDNPDLDMDKEQINPLSDQQTALSSHKDTDSTKKDSLNIEKDLNVQLEFRLSQDSFGKNFTDKTTSMDEKSQKTSKDGSIQSGINSVDNRDAPTRINSLRSSSRNLKKTKIKKKSSGTNDSICKPEPNYSNTTTTNSDKKIDKNKSQSDLPGSPKREPIETENINVKSSDSPEIKNLAEKTKSHLVVASSLNSDSVVDEEIFDLRKSISVMINQSKLVGSQIDQNSKSNSDTQKEPEVQNYKKTKQPTRKIVSSGLHFGNYFEAVTGSMYKANTYFYSNDIDLTNLLQISNQVYDTNLLMTEEIYRYLPECIKVKSRLIDQVTFPTRFSQVYSFYSVDFFPEEQQPMEFIDNSSREERKRRHIIIKQQILDNIGRGAKNSQFLEEMDIQSIVSKDDDFRRDFRNAHDFFKNGMWDKSLECIKLCQKRRPRDGPTIEIYKYMQELNFVVPNDWKGVKDLEKRLSI